MLWIRTRSSLICSSMSNLFSEFQTITAGKYKRTITPTKKVMPEDIKKSKEDIEEVLKLFKAFVKENRPSLDIGECPKSCQLWLLQHRVHDSHF